MMKALQPDKFGRFYDSLLKLIRIYLVGLVIFMVFRILLIWFFGNSDELSLYKKDLFKAFWVGYKFDTMALAYTMLLIAVFMLAGFLVPARFNYQRFMNLLMRWYFVLSYFILIFLLTTDFFFFKFFQSHFNLLVFGIVEDDTKAVLQSVWSDYPVIRLILMFIGIIFLLSWVFKRITEKRYNCKIKPLWAKVVFILLFSGIYFLGLRGSVGVFPLEKDDITISPNNFINSIVPNGPFALIDAIADRENYSIDPDMGKTLQRYNFDNNRQVVESYLGKKLTGLGNPLDSLFSRTPKDPFLEQNPPNVIFILMESMSNYYLDFHSNSFNLLGSLEKELGNCLLYRNFLSCHNGTVHTLEGLVVDTPLTPLSQSKYFNHSFSTSCALPFVKKGYHTAFITGAKLGWRNLGKFVEKQYFQQVEGNSSIMEKVAGASESEWGVFDEFLFSRIFDCLSESAKNNQPAFIFGFTTSNHTPYVHPETYKPYPLIMPQSVVKVLRTNEEIARKNFTNYQYANDCLGKFIERVRNSPFGKNTIIAASGDHNTLQLFDFSDGQLLQKLSVPFVLYVPEQYRRNFSPDTRIFASQKDVFPTLFNLALSDARYANMGFNLFDHSISRDTHFGINAYTTAFDDVGAVIVQNSPLFYKWSSPEERALKPVNQNEKPELTTLFEKAKAYTAASTLLIQQEIQENEKAKKQK